MRASGQGFDTQTSLAHAPWWKRLGYRLADVAHRSASSYRVVPVAFLGLALIGTLLLKLPASCLPGRSLGWLDAFFVAMSAVCVTGLTPVNVAEVLSPLGQGILLFLIQSGGIGISTAATFFVLLGGQRLSLRSEQALQGSLGRLRQARPLDIFAYSLATIFICELAGVLSLFHLLHGAQPDQAPLATLWQATFHAVSAFCNAGFSIWPEGATRWREHHGILATLNLLVIAGGIGLLTLVNLRYWYFWRRNPRRRGQLRLQTKLSVITTSSLILIGALVVLFFEQGHTFQDIPLADQVSWALFHSVNSRTAGFNVVDVGQMHAGTLLLTMLGMFIGGAPGSMAGGIKTLTFALLVMTAWHTLRRRPDIQCFRRRIPASQVSLAVMIALLGGAVVSTGVLGLLVTEEFAASSTTTHRWLAVAFEGFSAFGTTGLSTGITPHLTSPGKLLVTLLMFVGRVGPLMLAIYLSRPALPWRVRYPDEEMCLG